MWWNGKFCHVKYTTGKSFSQALANVATSLGNACMLCSSVCVFVCVLVSSGQLLATRAGVVIGCVDRGERVEGSAFCPND